MFCTSIDKYSNALVIGTGGGNDIVSALIPAQHLQARGIRADVAGILSPGAIHRFDGRAEEVVNRIQGAVERAIPGLEEIPISFFDGLLPGYAAEVGIGEFYDFSIRYGTSRLVEEVNALVASNGYDLVVAVDVGGDILARGAEDPTLLSPVMDFTSLYLLGQLEVDSLLVEFGLGTDGELRPAGMDDILTELSEMIVYESMLSADDPEVERFIEVFDKVRAVRVGHTATMTLQTLEADEDIVTEYRCRSQVGRRKWHTPFEVVLPATYAGKVYVFHGKGLAERRSHTAFAYENPLEQYVRLKQICPQWKTELDLSYLWSEDGWTNAERQGDSLFLLAPSTAISHRREIMQYGLAHSGADMMLLLESDTQSLDTAGFLHADAGRFLLVTDRLSQDQLSVVAQQVADYQSNANT